MYDVSPFKPSFRVFDKDAKRFTGDVFDCPIEAHGFISSIVKQHPNYLYSRPSVSYTLRLEPDYTYKVLVGRSFLEEEFVTYGGGIRFRSPRDIYVTKSVPASHYCIIDSFGHVITDADIKFAIGQQWVAARSRRWVAGEESDKTSKRLEIIKGSARKYKATYGTRRRGIYSGIWHDSAPRYDSEVTGHHRVPHCQQERRVNVGHEDEYGPGIVRSSRRGRYSLPSSYDDRQCQVYDQRKSWKHNSKRRKQWVPK